MPTVKNRGIKLKAGMNVTCTIDETHIPKAKIQLQDGMFFICQNKKNGSMCIDRMGFSYSWAIGTEKTRDILFPDEVKNLRVVPNNGKNYFTECLNCGVDLKRKTSNSGYCKECLTSYRLHKCYKCGKYYRNILRYNACDKRVCEKCIPTLPKCFICGIHIIPRYKLSTGEFCCTSCKHMEFGVTHGHFNNFSRMKHEGNEKNYIGFELELEVKEKLRLAYRGKNKYSRGGGVHYSIGSMFMMIFEKLGIKNQIFSATDGSLSCGIEFQSAPCTYAYLTKRFPLKKFFIHLKKYFSSLNSCGLHFHMSRETLTNNDISKLFLFIDNNKDILWKLSLRGRSDYCSPYTLDFDWKRNKFTSSKHLALNVCQHTVEFRLFKAPETFKDFMVALQFTNLMRIFVQGNSKSSFVHRNRWEDFKSMAKVYGYNYLLEGIKERCSQ